MTGGSKGNCESGVAVGRAVAVTGLARGVADGHETGSEKAADTKADAPGINGHHLTGSSKKKRRWLR